jgi:hypothetical protein
METRAVTTTTATNCLHLADTALVKCLTLSQISSTRLYDPDNGTFRLSRLLLYSDDCQNRNQEGSCPLLRLARMLRKLPDPSTASLVSILSQSHKTIITVYLGGSFL